MKILTLIIFADARQALADMLRGMPQVQDFTFTQVEGHAVQHDRGLSARDHVVGYVPQIRVDIMLDETQVEAVLGALCNSQSGLAGQGRYWIGGVEKHGQL